jgi:hypothetical protein
MPCQKPMLTSLYDETLLTARQINLRSFKSNGINSYFALFNCAFWYFLNKIITEITVRKTNISLDSVLS